MKRKVIAALLLGMAITVTGCSGNTTKDTDTTTEAASDASSETTADSSSESEAATEAADARTTKHWIMSNWETTKDWK